MTGLSTRGLIAGHGRRALLGPLDLTLPGGRFVCLIGANGAGKSTLIRTLCGMQAALSGEVLLDGARLSALTANERARRLAVVLTERTAVPLMTGRELAALGRYPHLGWGGRLGKEDREEVEQALQRVGAHDLAGRLVTEMSDGERQKIMIARALAQQPSLLVLDEATAYLDLPRRVATMHLLRQLAREQGLSVLLSTHDLELALRYADALWLIDGQRRLHAGAPEDLALGGALGDTFAADGLAFDLERAELRVGHEGQRHIRLEGEGLHRVWAQRALQRMGYTPHRDARQTVSADARGYCLTQADGAHQRFTTLEALTDVLAFQASTRGESTA
ncbi:ABC transporter ATP-binding protein [Hydrogenophaga laconesensis]|uniref:Iron complex transport system ATP-binding protein n=1 Tax=Hydrogenophaga laconesensis TaxID=1805971 RepID=A0ABU1V8L4_9BURK|nr:ABC transporter ATP-binding protein [Hydrogenophaga laconesensis]MDR7093798.1 iron complex transport system ATP-binding protein [Hydrogenophaga laconesensis]